jgi:hypothetical protein
MKHLLLPMLALASLACSCVVHEHGEVRQQIVSADAHEREALFAPLRALEGRWEGLDPQGNKQTVEFKLTSGGSALREVMFPGSEHEMTNMYTLDGNRLRMTHYCAGGNQPHLLGSMVQAGRIEFESEVVSDLKQADELYMGSMTLVLVDADHIEEHWRALKSGKVDHEVVFPLTRVK